MSQVDAIARLLAYGSSPYGQVTAWICSALYQSAGLTFVIGALAKPCWTVWYHDRVPLSGKGLVECLSECRPQVTIFTPSALEMMVHEPGGMDILKATSGVAVFGAICPQELGDYLIREAVNLSTGYAMSEPPSLLTSSLRMREDPTDKDWDFISPIPGPDRYMWFKPIPTPAGGDAKDELYELVILKGLENFPAVLSNSNDPPGSFCTGDILVKHPSKENCWKIIRRKKDQINIAMPVVVIAHDYESVVRAGAAHADVEEITLLGQGTKKLGMSVFMREGAERERARDVVWQVLEEKINPR